MLNANNLFKLSCFNALIEPIAIDSIDIIIIIGTQVKVWFWNGESNKLTKTIRAANLGKVIRTVVTEVGDPSYTSGVHIWNGAADSLKATPEIINTNPKDNIKLSKDWSENCLITS